MWGVCARARPRSQLGCANGDFYRLLVAMFDGRFSSGLDVTLFLRLVVVFFFRSCLGSSNPNAEREWKEDVHIGENAREETNRIDYSLLSRLGSQTPPAFDVECPRGDGGRRGHCGRLIVVDCGCGGSRER